MEPLIVMLSAILLIGTISIYLVVKFDKFMTLRKVFNKSNKKKITK